MNINLREEETSEYISFYQDYLEEVQCLNKKVTDVLNEVMIESKYDKLQQRISGIIDAYMETIVNNIESGVFATWVESNGSLRSCLRTYRAGEAADEVCAQIEQSMGNLMQDILKIEKADAIITERPIVSEDGFEQLEDVCRNAHAEIQDIKSNYIAQVENRNDENEIYGTLHPLFEGVATNIESFFEASLNSFVELHEFVRGISVQLHNIAGEEYGRNSNNGRAGTTIHIAVGENSHDNDIDAYLFNYITQTVLGQTVIFNKSIWYRDELRRKRWSKLEIERINKRDSFIKSLLKKMEKDVKQEWKFAIEHKFEVSGKMGYKTEAEYLNALGLIGDSDSEITNLLSKVERARLWQGSFKAGQHVGQYFGRDNYTFDTLDAYTKLYKLQISTERESGNYFFGEEEYCKLIDMSASEVYDALQLCAYYGDEDHGKMYYGFRKYFMEYQVKPGKQLDVARGIIEANEHLAKKKSTDKIEQIFVTSEDFEKLEDFAIDEVNMDENDLVAEFEGTMYALASNMNKQENRKTLTAFKEITSFLYHKIYDESYDSNKTLSYSKIKKIMPIYKKFYEEYGNLLQDKFETLDKRREYVDREYIGVTMDRGNEKYFNGEEVWTFKSNAFHTYTVFDRVAEMLENIAVACETGKANDTNLIYGSYVLFQPIINGFILKKDGNRFSKFSKWASSEIIKVLELDENNYADVNFELENTGNAFSTEEFSEDNIELFVNVVEIIVKQVGVDDLNSSVEKNYTTLNNCRRAYSKRSRGRTSAERNIASNTYGRYTVTRKSIQAMAPVCNQANAILEPIDKFYKEKFESLEKGFEKVNSTIHAISSFIGLWGVGTWNLSKLFSATDSDSTILEKIQLGGLALASCTTSGKIINGGAHMLKIMDFAMPYLKKSKMLVKLSEKVWKLTRQDIQIPYVHKMMDQYMMEHYELKYGMSKGQSLHFEYIHNVAMTVKDNHQRRAFENSCFAAEKLMTPQNYTINESDPQKKRAIYCGVLLNLVRSGMCSKQDIESGTSNNIVDKLYNIYVSKENVRPRVDISPDSRVIG